MIYIIFSLLVQAASIFGAGGYPDQNPSQGSYPNHTAAQDPLIDEDEDFLSILFGPTEDAPTLQSQGYQNQAPSFVPPPAPPIQLQTLPYNPYPNNNLLCNFGQPQYLTPQPPVNQHTTTNHITQNFGPTFNTFSQPMRVNVNLGTTPSTSQFYNQPQIPTHTYQPQSQSFFQPQQPIPQATVYQKNPTNRLPQKFVPIAPKKSPSTPSPFSERDPFQNDFLNELFSDESKNNNNGFPNIPHDRPPASDKQPPLKKVAPNQNPEIQFQSKFFANPTAHKGFYQAFKIQPKNVNPPAPQQTEPRPIGKDMKLAQLIEEISKAMHASDERLPYMGPPNVNKDSDHEKDILRYILILSYCWQYEGFGNLDSKFISSELEKKFTLRPENITCYRNRKSQNNAINLSHLDALGAALGLKDKNYNKGRLLSSQIVILFKKFIKELEEGTNAHFGVQNRGKFALALISVPLSPERLFDILNNATFYKTENTSTASSSNNSGCSGEVIEIEDEEDEQDPDGGNTTQGNTSGNNTPVATSGNSSSKTKQTQSTTSTSQTQTGNTRQNISSARFFDLYVQMLRQERQAQQQAENNESYTRYHLDHLAENELNAIVDLHKENEIPAAFVYLAQLQTAYTTLQTTAYNTLLNHINHFAYAAILLALQQRHAVQNDIGCVPLEIF